LKKIKKVSVVHPYLEERLKDIAVGDYPKHHLWGLDALREQDEWETNLIDTQKLFLPSLLEKVLNRYFFKQSPGVKTEIACWQASKSSSLIYSVCGPLSLARFYKKTKLISWVFRKPINPNNHFLAPYSAKNLAAHSAFFCLTPIAEKWFSKYSFSKFIPWSVDLDMFDGKPPIKESKSQFFLATGKTGRDFQTLIEGAKNISVEIRIIGPKHQRPPHLPENVKWLDSSSDPPDQAINYHTLREWYAQSVGVCIPLSGDAEDTCGYTNMLEAMAMGKPVIMTSTGCLHINPKDHKFGISVEKGNSSAWTNAMYQIANNNELSRTFGNNGRKIVMNELSPSKFNQNIVSTIKDIFNG
jgi:glycosyltransferase involved in cell wall biosynthesis